MVAQGRSWGSRKVRNGGFEREQGLGVLFVGVTGIDTEQQCRTDICAPKHVRGSFVNLQ